jgi:hypothetical protein
MSEFYIVSCQESGSLRLPTIYNFTCDSSVYSTNVQHIQGLGQSRLGIADHAVTNVAHIKRLPSHLNGRMFDRRQV